MCRSLTPQVGVFRWQSVACSPECGAEYLRRLRIARGQVPASEVQEPEPEAMTEEQAESAEEIIPETQESAPKRTRKKKSDTDE